MGRQRTGYRIWAKGDRGVADYDLRQAQKSLARYQAQPDARVDVVAHLEQVVTWAEEAVVRFEARFQIGGYAK